MSAPMNHRRQVSRDALLDAAERLFIERGYAAVSTRDLAEEAGVNLAAIQYHFGSKAKLFVEAVRRIMSRKEHTSPFATLEGPHGSPHEAAVCFARFVALFLKELAAPTGPDVCRIIFREAFGETEQEPEIRNEIISSMVEGLHRPSLERLVGVLRAISPDVPTPEVELHAQSIIAQCTFYRTHEPFLCLLSSCSIASATEQQRIARHIARMTLLALSWNPEQVNSILSSAAQPLPETHVNSDGASRAVEESI